MSITVTASRQNFNFTTATKFEVNDDDHLIVRSDDKVVAIFRHWDAAQVNEA